MAIQVGRCLIPDHLEKLGWTQTELANRTGISVKTISAYCTGRAENMSLFNALMIARALGCEPRDLYVLKW